MESKWRYIWRLALLRQNKFLISGWHLTHFIPTTTVVVVTLSIPTTTVVVVAHCIPTTTFVVDDNDLSNLSAVNRPRARNPRDTCAVNRMYYHCSCTAAIEQVLCSLRAVLTKLVTIVAESLSPILPKWLPRMIRSVMWATLVRNSMILSTF